MPKHFYALHFSHYFILYLAIRNIFSMKTILTLFAIFMTGCASTNNQLAKSTDVETQLSAQEVSLNAGYKMLVNGNAVGAINKHFKGLTEQCEKQYANSQKQVYAARSQVETLFYMLKAMSEDKDAIVVSSTCAQSNYFMGYASLDLGQIHNAERYVKRALEFSPVNAMYLSELAHIYQVNKDWDNALALYSKAEENASVYSPDQVKLAEITRAKRGMGFVLIELGQLDKAKLKFEQCLALDPNDKNALNEIQYIESLTTNS